MDYWWITGETHWIPISFVVGFSWIPTVFVMKFQGYSKYLWLIASRFSLNSLYSQWIPVHLLLGIWTDIHAHIPHRFTSRFQWIPSTCFLQILNNSLLILNGLSINSDLTSSRLSMDYCGFSVGHHDFFQWNTSWLFRLTFMDVVSLPMIWIPSHWRDRKSVV